ncbi:MAG: hypothetical protein WBJ82_00670 [Tepidanaerobacteraceae bacterium]
MIDLEKARSHLEELGLLNAASFLDACFLQEEIPHFCKEFSPGTGGEFLC